MPEDIDDGVNELPRTVDADDGMTDFGDDSSPLPGTVIKNFGKLRKARNCKMCVHEECGTWEQKITDGETTQKNAAKEMGLTDQVVSDHMRNHFSGMVLDNLVRSPTIAKTVLDMEGATAVLKGILEKLLLRSNTVLSMPIDPKSEFAVKANISEIREVTKLLMEMQGMLQPATRKFMLSRLIYSITFFRKQY